jgi:hypothetical protein
MRYAEIADVEVSHSGHLIPRSGVFVSSEASSSMNISSSTFESSVETSCSFPAKTPQLSSRICFLSPFARIMSVGDFHPVQPPLHAALTSFMSDRTSLALLGRSSLKINSSTLESDAAWTRKNRRYSGRKSHTLASAYVGGKSPTEVPQHNADRRWNRSRSPYLGISVGSPTCAKSGFDQCR